MSTFGVITNHIIVHLSLRQNAPLHQVKDSPLAVRDSRTASAHGGEIQRERGAAMRIVFHRHAALVSIHDELNKVQAQTGTRLA